MATKEISMREKVRGCFGRIYPERGSEADPHELPEARRVISGFLSANQADEVQWVKHCAGEAAGRALDDCVSGDLGDNQRAMGYAKEARLSGTPPERDALVAAFGAFLRSRSARGIHTEGYGEEVVGKVLKAADFLGELEDKRAIPDLQFASGKIGWRSIYAEKMERVDEVVNALRRALTPAEAITLVDKLSAEPAGEATQEITFSHTGISPTRKKLRGILPASGIGGGNTLRIEAALDALAASYPAPGIFDANKGERASRLVNDVCMRAEGEEVKGILEKIRGVVSRAIGDALSGGEAGLRASANYFVQIRRSGSLAERSEAFSGLNWTLNRAAFSAPPSDSGVKDALAAAQMLELLGDMEALPALKSACKSLGDGGFSEAAQAMGEFAKGLESTGLTEAEVARKLKKMGKP